MADPPERSLTDLLTNLRFILRRPVDFAATDTDTTLAKARLLTAAATYFNVLAVSGFGGRLGLVREDGLVEQVVGAAFQTFGGEDPHPKVWRAAGTVDVSREPRGGRYRSVTVHGRGETLSPLAFPDLSVSVDEIVGEPSAE